MAVGARDHIDKLLVQKYQSLQVEIAAYLLDKRGATGEIAHSENGISRSYENGDICSRIQ